jgi:hypothetical protein
VHRRQDVRTLGGVAFSKDNALVRTKRTWLVVLSVVSMTSGFAASQVWAKAPTEPAFGPWATLGLGAFVACYIGSIALAYAWKHWWRGRVGVVRADSTGLWIEEERLASRRDVRHGYLRHEGERAFVRLGRPLRPIDVEIADETEGRALLVALRLDAGRSVGAYTLSTGTSRSAWKTLLGAILAIVTVTVLGPALRLGAAWHTMVPWLLGLILVVSAISQVALVSIGADGLRLRRFLRRRRFVPFSAIESASTDDGEIEIRVRDGQRIKLPQQSGESLLYERIREQLAVHNAGARADATAFSRAGLTTDEWLRRAGSALEDASFRTPAVHQDKLWRIVEDATAPATARAGAAVALRRALDDEGRVRLREVADACAAPRLGVALEAVADEAGEQRLHGVLELLEDDEENGYGRAR